MRVNEVHEQNLVSIAVYCGRQVAFQEKESSLHLQEVHRSDCVIDLKERNCFIIENKLLGELCTKIYVATGGRCTLC